MHPVAFHSLQHLSKLLSNIPAKHIPYEGEASVVLSIVAKGIHDGILFIPIPSLNGEDCGEDSDPTHQADNVVEEWRQGSQLHCTMCFLHESSKGNEGPNTSS